MNLGPPEDRGAIGFAEKVLALLDKGTFTATYKYAVLLGLMDLCLEKTTRSGGPPEVLTTRELAEKIIGLYWGQTASFGGEGPKILVLQQNAGGQAEILKAILKFREAVSADPLAPLGRARAGALDRYEALVRKVEWKLIEMPLPRLQYVGDCHDPFIYRIGWDRKVDAREAAAPEFDRRIYLQGRAGEYLVQLSGLLRPLIQREWAAMVARLNRGVIEDARLEEFLFGQDRVSMEPVRRDLRDLQEGRCFYCGDRIAGQAVVDHFIPWARYPDNDIENLVVADVRCNGAKRDFIAASEHVIRWRERLTPASKAGKGLEEIARRAKWDRHPDRTLGVARAIYLRLPSDAKLWSSGRQFVAVDLTALSEALGEAG